MEFNNFLVASKWEILRFLAEKPASPLEISEKLGTTVSYVSQQLKILDAAGLISKKKTGFIEKGKPRNLFTIKKEVAHLAILTKGFGKQGQINLTPEKECILKTWMVGNLSIHTPSLNFFMGLDPFWNSLEGIFVENEKFSKIFVICIKKEIRPKIENALKKFLPKTNLFFGNFEEFNKVSLEKELIPLYVSPEFSNNLKGGLEKNE